MTSRGRQRINLNTPDDEALAPIRSPSVPIPSSSQKTVSPPSTSVRKSHSKSELTNMDSFSGTSDIQSNMHELKENDRPHPQPEALPLSETLSKSESLPAPPKTSSALFSLFS